MTQNSDLIDQFGGEFVIDSNNQVRLASTIPQAFFALPLDSNQTYPPMSTPQTQIEFGSTEMNSLETQG